MTLLSERAGNPLSAAIQITADIAGVPIFSKVAPKDQIKEIYKQNPGVSFPLLQVDKDTRISQVGAIAGLVARESKNSQASQQLLGKTTFEQAKIDQVLTMVAVDSANIKEVEGTLFGSAISANSTKSLTDIKALMKKLNDMIG